MGGRCAALIGVQAAQRGRKAAAFRFATGFVLRGHEGGIAVSGRPLRRTSPKAGERKSFPEHGIIMENQERQTNSVVKFYDSHPINEEQIIETLQSKGIDLDGLSEEVLKDFDQDHYGGVEAVDILAEKAAINASSRVLDVCSGMGGPARYLAHRHGCPVVGIDITESRVASARRLTALVKLEHLVSFEVGNAVDMHFPEACFDVVIGQEAWVHIPERHRLISEIARLLKAGGRVAFTDIVRAGALDEGEFRKLKEGMAFAGLETAETYRNLLEQRGFALLESEDVGKEWVGIVSRRLEMYRCLKKETVRKFGEAHYRAWDDFYEFFVSMFGERKLSGVRIVAERGSR